MQDLSNVAKLAGNEYLMAASTFHSLHAISKQLAPVASGGMHTVEAPGFTLHCYESPTGLKFFVTAKPKTPDIALFLKRIYEFYADFVLKVRKPTWMARAVLDYYDADTSLPLALQNPFYELEMPIRVRLFDHAIEQLARSTGLGNPKP